MSDVDPNSALYWLDRLTRNGLGGWCPRSIFVPYDHHRLLRRMMGDESDPGDPSPALFLDEVAALLTSVRKACSSIGYPCFLRTDLASAKHEGPTAYQIKAPIDIDERIVATVEDNEMKFSIGGPTPRALLIREWLSLDGSFHAFGGHLIAKEWRFFVDANHVECRHFYWPAEAIRNPDRPTWQDDLSRLSGEVLLPEQMLAPVAIMAAKVCDRLPAWSVDFARARDGKWWLIDMASAEESWHPEHV